MNKILLNGLQYEPNGAGISRYTGKLIEAFIKENYPIDILMRRECVDKQDAKNIIIVDENIKSSTRRIIEEQLMQSKRYNEYNLIHFPDYATPLFYRGSKIGTMHDMAMHTMKDKYTLMQGVTKNTLLEYTIRTAEHLICNSVFTKKELLAYYPKVKAEISVIDLGVDEPIKIQNRDTIQKVLRKFEIHKSYMLFVGTISPHKNIKALLEAFVHIKKEGITHQLVIGGKKGWMYEEVFTFIKEMGLEKEVIFTDYITEEELEVLYVETDLFVSTSLYEGFGFPPLEAMKRGCPVLVSDIEIFKETCKEYAMYCNPKDSVDIAKQLLYIITNKELARRLSARGIEYVKRFNWEQTAKQTFEVYQEILNQKENKR